MDLIPPPAQPPAQPPSAARPSLQPAPPVDYRVPSGIGPVPWSQIMQYNQIDARLEPPGQQIWSVYITEHDRRRVSYGHGSERLVNAHWGVTFNVFIAQACFLAGMHVEGARLNPLRGPPMTAVEWEPIRQHYTQPNTGWRWAGDWVRLYKLEVTENLLRVLSIEELLQHLPVHRKNILDLNHEGVSPPDTPPEQARIAIRSPRPSPPQRPGGQAGGPTASSSSAAGPSSQ